MQQSIFVVYGNVLEWLDKSITHYSVRKQIVFGGIPHATLRYYNR